jgi:hypothetical protein
MGNRQRDMKNISIIGVTALAAISLSGCGGGGGGGGLASDAEVGVGVTNTDAIARFAALNEGFVNVSSATSVQTDVPGSGLATYDGHLGFDVRGALPGGGNDVDASLVADLNIGVNFGSDTMSGSATNFLYADTNGNFDRPSGTITITGGIVSLPRNGLPDLEGVISADGTGTLQIDQGDGVDKPVAFSLDLSGQFGGVGNVTSASTPEAMRGFVVGAGSGGGLTLVAPNGRFAADTASAGIVD